MTNTVIGRVVATEKNPTTIDNFTFWTDPELILNPFDIVKVQHVNNSYSYGVIEDIAHITDAASFLTNFISSDFGDVDAEENTLRVGMNYVTAKVACNTNNIYIPLQSNAKVMLATAEEINYALGLNDIRNPLVCGYLEMYEGTKGCEKVTLGGQIFGRHHGDKAGVAHHIPDVGPGVAQHGQVPPCVPLVYEAGGHLPSHAPVDVLHDLVPALLVLSVQQPLGQLRVNDQRRGPLLLGAVPVVDLLLEAADALLDGVQLPLRRHLLEDAGGLEGLGGVSLVLHHGVEHVDGGLHVPGVGRVTNPRFDKVGITTLFTFYWDITIDTINFAKQLCKKQEDVMVGGIMSSLLADEVYEATGIRPFIGLLNHPGDIDEGNELIIDELALDYSILEEIDYIYPANNAYFAYMTRGCVNRCKFCAVPTLEPQYCDYINLKKRIEFTDKRFGARKDLLLLDNNVLASNCYDQIIDEIRDCGFGVGASYTPPNEYEIMINNLRDSYNDRAYIRKAISIYKEIMDKLKDEPEKAELYRKLEEAHCLYHYTASKEEILGLDGFVRPLYEKTHRPSKRKRIVDFNQGIDSRLITKKSMDKLAEVNIYPLRIAFDHWSLKDTYERAIRTAVGSGIKNLSNHLLYNFEDKPEELYHRLRMNVDLCEELGASIYSFPMKYHPINDKEFFMNRDYIGKYWNRKFIRAVQAVLNSTKGKIGRGVDFFEEAFGRDLDEFMKILWMPETFIIYRRIYDADLRTRLAERYTTVTAHDCNLTSEWWEKFSALSPVKLEQAKAIIAHNKFKDGDYECDDKEICDVLSYYKITRDDTKND